jgi:hypothetical protein
MSKNGDVQLVPAALMHPIIKPWQDAVARRDPVPLWAFHVSMHKYVYLLFTRFLLSSVSMQMS